jgi:hypothetical protein
LIEDQGSPSRNNYAYRTNEGVLHLDSLVHITKDGRNTPYLRQRAYTPDGDNGWRATINDVPYDQALRIGVNPDQIDGGCVKMFTSNGTIEGGAPWPIKLWHPSSDPALGGDVFSELTPQELREVSIVGDVLKAAMHCVGENVGKAALLELFRGAA